MPKLHRMPPGEPTSRSPTVMKNGGKAEKRRRPLTRRFQRPANGCAAQANRARLPRKDQLNLCHVQAEASNDAALPTGSHLPDEGSFRVPGVTSNGEVSPSSLPIWRSVLTSVLGDPVTICPCFCQSG